MTLLDKITEKVLAQIDDTGFTQSGAFNALLSAAQVESLSATETVSILKSRKNRTSRESIFSSMEKQTAKKFIFRLLLMQAE